MKNSIATLTVSVAILFLYCSCVAPETPAPSVDLLLGKLHELGTVEAGKLADLLVVDGDPLADISVIHKIELVIKNGSIVVDNR